MRIMCDNARYSQHDQPRPSSDRPQNQTVVGEIVNIQMYGSIKLSFFTSCDL